MKAPVQNPFRVNAEPTCAVCGRTTHGSAKELAKCVKALRELAKAE